jgi:hypothetical protein
MKWLDDTTPEARRVLVDGYRRMSLARRFQIMDDAYGTARVLHEMGFRQRHPEATPEDVRQDWARVTLGPLADVCVARHGSRNMDAQSLSNLPVIREVMSRFRQLGIPCALGGSWASSVYGVPRYTQDADVTAMPFPRREAEFAALFGDEYYLSIDAMRQANQDRGSFNIIHTITNFKIDVFIQKTRPFDQSLLKRCKSLEQPGVPGGAIEFISPEDVILHKLEWFRLGGETSDRQWGDILGVPRTQGGRLDSAYLDLWAAQLNVTDLLQKAREQV